MCVFVVLKAVVDAVSVLFSFALGFSVVQEQNHTTNRGRGHKMGLATNPIKCEVSERAREELDKHDNNLANAV